MCYLTVLSTTTDQDLTAFNAEGVCFSRDLPGIPQEQFLRYPQQWYVGSAHGCSCGFRHLMACNFSDLGFAEPVDWFEEDSEDIAATLSLVKALRQIAATGARLDCVDAWEGDSQDDAVLAGEVVVDFARISDPAFRLIEGYHLEFVGAAGAAQVMEEVD
ncbi:MAG: hypothetical protein HKN19_01020 [Halioglobus sp.]|nr:hypothetical protein [Halioglobus sp.]